MRNRLGHKMVLGWLATGLLLLAGNAQAVSLGKIEVASHLGEPFYAEIPLSLDGNESISRVFVEIAAPTDYRILEVYRDAVLNSVRADVESDSRGSRIELSSRSGLDAPFFNLVLKVRYDRATHFKKYPIFLDLPKSIQPSVKRAPLPSVHALKSPAGVDTSTSVAAAPAVNETVAAPAAVQTTTGGSFAPYDGWARTGRYGPMVYGDTISTVAERLRVDDTFSRQQVMMALFEKNRAKFDQDNINLIKAGTYLDVPRAAEVERITPSQARNLIAEHEKRWKDLTKQPRYAAVAEAQRTRYSKRVRAGKQANGTAAAPEATMSKQAGGASAASKETAAGAGKPEGAASSGATAGDGNAALAELAALKQQNEALQARLSENEKQLEAL
ncbi:MAG: FimV/HubP family polar landmark protein, partial [Mariprofundaceae bacterium]